MRSHYNLRISHHSSASSAGRGELFHHSLGSSLLTTDASVPVAYPKGVVLFLEGQIARGIFAVCSGKVKVSTSSQNGRSIILKIAEVGELLGIPATLSGKPYEVTAEVWESAQINFIPRSIFLRFLQVNPNAIAHVAQLLTESHYAEHEVIQSLGLSRTASEKLARFFLGWSASHAGCEDRLQIALTRGEIGEMIGVSRETVTRLMTIFKKRNLLTVNGATINICDRVALQNLAGI